MDTLMNRSTPDTNAISEKGATPISVEKRGNWAEVQEILTRANRGYVSAALGLSLFLALGSGFSGWQIYRGFRQDALKQFKLQKLAGETVYLDEVLTLSAYMAASTGNEKWIQRYQDYEPKLLKTIDAVIKADPEAKVDFEKIQTANDKLVEMETRSFKLVREDKDDEARALLFGDDYKEQKQIYSQGVDNTLTRIQEDITSQLQSYEQRLLQFTVLAGVSLPLLVLIWLAVLISAVRRYNLEQRQLQERQLQLEKEQAEAERHRREELEQAIFTLVNEIEEAADGNLLVRASLSSEETSTIADLFNAVIESLRDIALQVKESSSQVSDALGTNEQSIRQLAEQAAEDAEEIRTMLGSVEQMAQSVQQVAGSARQAAAIADDAYSTVQEGSSAMDETVNSILSLRSTVGETAKKMKRLGESSQKISQVVALIDEIALKTNLLAINASVEASRAGEQGQGFTVVAEQVGALAEQSAAATKEIAQIVASIQAETQEVAVAMEGGIAQVVDSTNLVETTKNRLQKVLEKSQDINHLMQSISETTISQAKTSKVVTRLMQAVTQTSEERSAFSRQVAQAMQDTAQVAKALESAVAQFKVDDGTEQPKDFVSLSVEEDRPLATLQV